MRAELEVADIFRHHGQAYRLAHDGHLGRVERRVMSAIELCRTAALGGHLEACEDCSHSCVAYNSCRNRHCPKCQTATREQWLAGRQADLLPVPYFHVVFTVPAEAAEIAFHNKAVAYTILFDAVAATLKTVAADPRTSVVRSASLPFSIPGDRPSPIIPISTVSFLAVRSLQASAGSPVCRVSTCPFTCSRACLRAIPRTASGRSSGRQIALFGPARPA